MPIDTLSRRDLLDELAMEFRSADHPLDFNQLAMDAGELFLQLRRRHAHLEAERKVLQLEIRDELMVREHNPVKKTEAEDQARIDPRYLVHLDQEREVEELRDRALILYRLAEQRAGLLDRTEAAQLRMPRAASPTANLEVVG